MRRAVLGLLLAAVFSANGCASLVASGVCGEPYGGTRWDAKELADPSPGEKIFAAIDLVPSFALDTALLPRTILLPGRGLRSGW